MSLTDDLTDAFFDDIIDLCGRLRIDAMDLLGVMMAESNVKANAKNPTSNASGLIQFLPSTLAHLGWTGTPESFRQCCQIHTCWSQSAGSLKFSVASAYSCKEYAGRQGLG